MLHIQIPHIELESFTIDEQTADQCSVCLENMQVGQQAVRLQCNHMFHENCIQRWTRGHNTCPVCREPITTEIHSQMVIVSRMSREVHITFRFWNNSETMAVFSRSSKISDIFQYLSHFALISDLGAHIQIRYVEESGMNVVFKTSEAYGFLRRNLFDLQVDENVVMHVEYF